MMDEYYRVAGSLPEPLRSELMALNPALASHIQEMRLRAGQPVQFTVKGRLTPAAKFLPKAEHLQRLEESALRECFMTLCRHSAYAYEEELRQGFLTLPDGSRVGVAGVRGSSGFANVTSLSMRVSRWVVCPLPGEVVARLAVLDGGILVAGAPGSGKTTFLRSMVEHLARTDRIFSVVDERGELTGDSRQLSCDVYARCPRAQGIQMALRCMNPQAIVCDELGTVQDAAALEEGVASGAVFLASVHCDSLDNLSKKPQLARLLATGAFSLAVLLDGRERPGTVAELRSL